jgi:hypothetical protein
MNVKPVASNKPIVYSASATTAIAGILHIIMVPRLLEFAFSTAVFFLIAGILQLFWVYPTLRMSNKVWHYIGIGGTVGLIVLWAVTRVPNPLTNRALPVNEMGIAVQVFQVAFVALLALLIAKKRDSK